MFIMYRAAGQASGAVLVVRVLAPADPVRDASLLAFFLAAARWQPPCPHTTCPSSALDSAGRANHYGRAPCLALAGTPNTSWNHPLHFYNGPRVWLLLAWSAQYMSVVMVGGQAGKTGLRISPRTISLQVQSGSSHQLAHTAKGPGRALVPLASPSRARIVLSTKSRPIETRPCWWRMANRAVLYNGCGFFSKYDIGMQRDDIGGNPSCIPYCTVQLWGWAWRWDAGASRGKARLGRA